MHTAYITTLAKVQQHRILLCENFGFFKTFFHLSMWRCVIGSRFCLGCHIVTHCDDGLLARFLLQPVDWLYVMIRLNIEPQPTHVARERNFAPETPNTSSTCTVELTERYCPQEKLRLSLCYQNIRSI